jgi:hypothetical protein
LVTVELTCGHDNLQMIAPPVPVSDLIVDPLAGQLCDHGPFTALAQGADWRGKLERLDTLLGGLPEWIDRAERGIKRRRARAALIDAN